MPEYRLLQRHKLNKEWREVGEVVEINDELGRWWKEQGIGVPVKAPVAPRVVQKVAAAVPEIGTPRAFVPQPTRFPKCCGWKK